MIDGNGSVVMEEVVIVAKMVMVKLMAVRAAPTSTQVGEGKCVWGKRDGIVRSQVRSR